MINATTTTGTNGRTRALSSGLARPRSQTRQRILDTALRRFAENGYAATSVRDLADELGVTKAAVHYHFSAKEQIVAALLTPLLEQLAEVVERHAAQPGSPVELLLGLRDVLADSGPLLTVLAADPSVAEPCGELHTEHVRLAARTAEVLAGEAAAPERLLRAHCALGAFTAGWDRALRSAAASGRSDVGETELAIVLEAALAALGTPAGS